MKVRVILDKQRASGTNICPVDQRGKHNNHIPAYGSHYSRRHTANKYFSGDLSISKMYRFYSVSCHRCDRFKIMLVTADPKIKKIFRQSMTNI
ncbi:hypothetical protein PR048_009130 [Dryococelus australis]|uniref:Uncharacterized protein n=1 Tax=Dryococelus australis TaxID=614101 RepID=A0ABQ9I039_9NEOP|nr:hypothetical protein PR048_009130 [Dryococelus australis]